MKIRGTRCHLVPHFERSIEAVNRSYDILCMGRSCIDLYSNDIGAPFAEIKSFAAYVGGCPTNISVGARRLGLRSATLTAVGAVGYRRRDIG